MEKYYYDIHITIFAYSLLVVSDTPLSNDEVIKKALKDKSFLMKEDADFVDCINELTKEEVKKYTNFKAIRLWMKW